MVWHCELALSLVHNEASAESIVSIVSVAENSIFSLFKFYS